MKRFLIFLAIVSISISTQALLHGDQMSSGAYAVSPDHPHTWVSGADNVHQALRWDSQKQLLFVDVKYSTILYSDDANPTEEQDYSLSFPSVHLDPAHGVFTSKGITIGKLHHGLFGANIVLDKGVELDVHRHHGRIFAEIVPSERG